MFLRTFSCGRSLGSCFFWQVLSLSLSSLLWTESVAWSIVCGQKIAVGRLHAGQATTVHVAETVFTIDLGTDATRTVRRTTTTPVRNTKAHRPRKADHG